jgi:hypothetical protein
VQRVSPVRETADLYLSAIKFPLANTANTLIVERIPSAKSVSGTQNRQSIVECDVSDHNRKDDAHCVEINNRDAG